MKNPFILILLITLAGCAGAPVATTDSGKDSHPQFEHKGQSYREALEKNKKIAAESPGADAGADAHLQVAYILAAYDNPQKNYEQALLAFEDYITHYPGHPRIAEAQNWRAALKTIADLKAENSHLKQVIDELKTIDIRHEEKRTQ